jgi:hypothetical protein
MITIFRNWKQAVTHTLTPIIRDERVPRIPRHAVGMPVISHRQTTAYDCGSAVVFTALCTKCMMRGQPIPSPMAYRVIKGVVKPDPEWGAEFSQVERGLKRFGMKFEHKLFRRHVLRKSLSEGSIALVCIPWTEDVYHWVVLTALNDRNALMANLPYEKSWQWQSWEDFRPDSIDDMLAVRM